jgi:hypothetical protein
LTLGLLRDQDYTKTRHTYQKFKIPHMVNYKINPNKGLDNHGLCHINKIHKVYPDKGLLNQHGENINKPHKPPKFHDQDQEDLFPTDNHKLDPISKDLNK